MTTPLEIKCSICTHTFDWNKGYGRDQRCCSKECYIEFDWRRTLSIMGRAYYPDPRAEHISNANDRR